MSSTERRIRGLGYGVALLLSLGVLSMACGDKEPPLTILDFSRPWATILVGGSPLRLTVSLNRTSNEPATVGVIVEQELAHTVALDRTQLVFAVGEQHKTLEITGRADSEGRFAKIIFTIAENGAKQKYEVKVEP